MVPGLSIFFMVVSCISIFGLAVALPVFLKRKGADLLPFFVGAAVMLLFAFVLEGVVHSFVLSRTSISSNILLFSVYGGLMAGLFEESGRFIAFKTVLRNSLDKKANALMYGAGHGCLEAIWILGFTMINNLVWSIMINNGNMAALFSSVPEGMEAQVISTIASLTGSPSILFLTGLIERIFALTIQISLSVFVWYAVKERKTEFYLYAIALHAAVDFISAFAASSGVSVVLIEALIGAFAALVAFLAKKIYKKAIE